MERKCRKPNRIHGYDYSQNGAYFITICTQNRNKLLSRITVRTGTLDCPFVELLPYGAIADRNIWKINAFYGHLSVDKYVIMPDHIHLLITIQNNQTKGQSRTPVPTAQNSEIAKFVSTFKRFRNKEYGKNIWQGRYYDHIIRNQQDYDEIWEYIENNPVKWFLQNQGYKQD